MRKHSFVNGEFYHVFNRGVDKRTIFTVKQDFDRFLRCLDEFNTIQPIGSLYTNSFPNKLSGRTAQKPLINIICYCLNSNHFHLILEQCASNGVSEFIKRLSGGYTAYFNFKYHRSGVLFQGKFKSVHIKSNEQLLHVSAYVNLNDRVHGVEMKKSISSMDEYAGNSNRNICKKDIILKQFNGSQEYTEFAESSSQNIIERKRLFKELEEVLLE